MSAASETLPSPETPPIAPADGPRDASVVLPTITTALRPTDRLALLDLMRILAASLVVWHHLAFYGPLSDSAYPLAPGLIDFCADEGRCAVQVFLVIGGFVAAASLGKRDVLGLQDAWAILRRRYVRIAGPYLVVLILAVFANWLAGRWMDHDSISAFPTVPQFLAHTVFLHDILGYSALTAGIWYLAIDFQLIIMLLTLLLVSQQVSQWSGISSSAVLQSLVLLLAGGSLFWFNLDDRWDRWAVYFFGSYALGLLTSWGLSGKTPTWCVWGYLTLMVLALCLEWRLRLAVSFSTGLAMLCAGSSGWLSHWTSGRWLSLAGQCSFSLFLIHFPICLLVNAWLSQYVLDSPALSLAGMFAAYGLSLVAALVFYFGVERSIR